MIAASPVYLDTSALAKLYVAEAGSNELETALAGRRDLVVSDLTITELTSAVTRRVREGELTGTHGRRIYTRMLHDVGNGEFRCAEITAAVHREAERLLMSIGRRVPLRAADALHLSLATLFGARVLLTFDRRMSAAARTLGTLELPALG